MAKRPTPDITALTVRERVLLFCIGSETVTNMIVKGLIVRDALGHPALTDDGRVTLRALLPEL